MFVLLLFFFLLFALSIFCFFFFFQAEDGIRAHCVTGVQTCALPISSFGISFLSCETDVRTGGSYRFVFGHPASEQPMAFFGRYIEVTPPSRLVWTNDEEHGAVTTVTFEEKDGKTLVVVHDLYPSKEALDGAIASGSTGAWPEQFEALDDLLTTLG